MPHTDFTVIAFSVKKKRKFIVKKRGERERLRGKNNVIAYR